MEVLSLCSHSYIPAIALGVGSDDDFGGRNNLSHPLNFSTPLRASGHRRAQGATRRISANLDLIPSELSRPS